MFKKFTNGCVRVVNRWLPDAFLFAIILTLIVFVAAMCATGMGPIDIIAKWGDQKGGFWNLLAFSMQMALVLVFGSAMASAKPCKKALRTVAGLCHDEKQAILVTTFVSTICCWLNWGFGLVIGALLAKEVVRRVPSVDYPLLIASAYSGFVIWHAGLSGSIPLDLVAGKAFGEVTYQAPITATVFHPMNLIMCGVILVLMPFVNYAMHPHKEHTVTVNPALLVDEAEKEYPLDTPAEKLEHSKILWIITVVFGFIYIVYYFVQNGFTLGLNIVNMIFLFLGLLLHGDLRRYVDAIGEAPAAVPVLCRYHGHDGGRQRSGRVSGGRYLPVLREHLQQRDVPHAVLPGSRYRQLLRPLRRRPVGRAGSHHDARRRGDGYRGRPYRHGHRLGRPVDQHDPAVLGAACSGYCQAVRPRHYGLSGDRPAVHRRGGLPGLPGLGSVLLRNTILTISPPNRTQGRRESAVPVFLQL